jgi:hypothetical protein
VASRSSNIRPAVADGQWHSFGNSSASVRTVSAGFVGGIRPGFGVGFRGGFGGFGCCGFGRWGWGGWGFGFGIGWPFWGPYWAFGWDPWWYNPYWYGPGYDGYADYSYDWSDNPPPYRPDSYNSQDAPNANLSPNYHLSSSLDNGSNYGPKNNGSNYGADSDSTNNDDATLSYSKGWTPFSAAGPLR